VWNESNSQLSILTYLKTFTVWVKQKKTKEGEIVVPLNRDLVNAGFDLIIIDEAHYLKNHESIRGKIMAELRC
jgi:SNF2 family DNA or RNA helicase